MALLQNNFTIINPSQMNRFPYLLLGNVYLNKSITVGILIGESTVICGEIEGREEGMEVDFLPFNNGEIKLFNAIKGTTCLLTKGLIIIILTEPIGKILAQALKDDENEDMLVIKPNGLFSFLDQHLKKNEEMSEMRCNGFLEDNLALVGYLQNYDVSVLKKPLSQRNSTFSYAQTLTSTFNHNDDLSKSLITHHIFETKIRNREFTNNCYFDGDDGFIIYEKKGYLMNSDNNTIDLLYKIEEFNCQKGTPLFIKRSNNYKKYEYILLGFHLHHQNSCHDDMKEFSSMPTISSLSAVYSAKIKSSLSKGILFTNALYNDIICTLNQKRIKSSVSNIICFTKSILPTTSTHCIVNYYFFNIFSCKGIINKHFSLSSIFKFLNDIYKIPQEYLQFSFGSSDLISYNDIKFENLMDSSMDRLSNGIIQDDQIEINIFCEVNIKTFSHYLSNAININLKDVKMDKKSHNKCILKSVLKLIKQYEDLSSHFYGLLFNDLKSVMIH